MKILIITDAWFPQVNGVVTTYSNIISQLSKRNIEVEVLHPGKFYSLPLFFYNEIKAAINPWKVIQKIKKSEADYIHMAQKDHWELLAEFIYHIKRSLSLRLFIQNFQSILICILKFHYQLHTLS